MGGQTEETPCPGNQSSHEWINWSYNLIVSTKDTVLACVHRITGFADELGYMKIITQGMELINTAKHKNSN